MTQSQRPLLDREQAILAFNRRVLAQASRTDVPLLERLRYLCIVSSNLDEFFEVRFSDMLDASRDKAAEVSRDDVERVADHPAAELALFHLFNRARDQGQTLAMAATLPPAQLPIGLPDLASRLTWGLTLPVRALSGDDTLQALSLRASHLGLQLPPAVGRYLMNRAPRDLPAQLALLDRLDQASLAAQRRLTIPFVKTLLEAPP